MSSYPGWPPAYELDRSGDAAPEPIAARAGDTLTWFRSFAAYPASVGYSLNYILNNSTQRIVLANSDCVASGDGFQITVLSAESKAWTPGKYQWLAIIQSADKSERHTVALGQISIDYDLLDATTPTDTRTPAEVALANLDLMIAGRAGDGVMEYEINGRRLHRYSMQEIMQLRAHYAAVVKRERRERGEIASPGTVAIYF